MGCDIHGWIEVKADEGKWIAVEKLFDRSRNYDRFAKLAGVRGEGPPPNGLPKNISETTNYWADFWEADAHSHSSLPAADAFKIFKDTGGPGYTEWDFSNFEMGDEKDNYRLVFWFDN